jgi:hypothetical protein
MRVPPRGQKSRWQITVNDAANTKLIFHAECEDEKEVQALATEARGHSQALKIWITDTYGKIRSWD